MTYYGLHGRRGLTGDRRALGRRMAAARTFTGGFCGLAET